MVPPQLSPEGILRLPKFLSTAATFSLCTAMGDSLEELLLAVLLPGCLAQASPNVSDEAECCLTEHTGRFHSKRDKVMADLQGSVLGTLQMLSFRCHGT